MMIAKDTRLPKEITALVHHVELNQAGWWEKTVQRLVLASVWLSDHSPNTEEISRIIKREFSLPLNDGKLNTTLKNLENQNFLVKLPGNTYRIPDAQREIFEQEISAAEKVESDVVNFFKSLVEVKCEGLDSTSVWSVFESEFLVPLINEIGSNAYHLIAGAKMVVDKSLVDNFLKKFDRAYDHALRDLVTAFLDPKKHEVTSHIGRMLHARFCVEASGLTEETINKLNETVGKQVNYRIFVDTNFLFSLLNLHDNPSNDAAKELYELISQLKSNLKIKLYIIPPTVDEVRRSIESAKYNFSSIPGGENFTQAALDVGISGMGRRFLNERLRRGVSLSSEDWFDPYLKDFVSIARGNGIEFFNEDLAGYSIRQDVVDDINFVLDAEKRRPEKKRKSYDKVAHDMILWHFAKDKRPAHIESPVDARDWILTVDFRLIGFDQHKQEISGENVPLCLHPTSLIQLLQFWVPRTREFEEAMLGSMRLPFLFQAFDIEAERTSLKILKGLGRFDGCEDIPTHTITRVILNDGLRSRLKSDHSLESDEVTLIRDVLVEEMKARAEAEALKAHQLHIQVEEKEEAILSLTSRNRSNEEEVDKLKAQLAKEEARARDAEGKLEEEGGTQKILKTDLDELKLSHARLIARLQYTGFIVFVAILSFSAVFVSDKIFQDVISIIGLYPAKVIAAVMVFVSCHLLFEMWTRRFLKDVAKLWFFRKVRKFRKWLWTVVFLIFVCGVLVNIFSDQIQQRLGQENNRNLPGSSALAQKTP